MRNCVKQFKVILSVFTILIANAWADDEHSRLIDITIQTFPITQNANRLSDNKHPLKVLSLNAAHGRGNSFSQLMLKKEDIHKNLDDIASYLIQEQADIVALQEIDAPSLWTGHIDQVAYLARKSGYAWAGHGINTQNVFGSYGTAILSKHPIVQARRFNFAPSKPTPQKGFTQIEFLWGAQNLSAISLHLDFSRRSVRQDQIAQVKDVVRRNPLPSIVMGDFNSQWSKTDSVVHRESNSPLWHAFAVESKDLPSYGDTRIDWIFITPELQFVNYSSGPATYSDHRPVIASIARSEALKTND